MSQAALLVAVRNFLRTEFSLDANSCEVGMDGQPKPAAGQFYLAVHPGNIRSVSGDYDLHEEVDFYVTQTWRMGVVPEDRYGIAAFLADPNGGDGVEAKTRRIVTAIHHNEDLRVAANALITGGASGKFVTAPLWINTQAPVMRDYNWFSHRPPKTDLEFAKAGVSQTIVFGRCQRLQSIPDMD